MKFKSYILFLSIISILGASSNAYGQSSDEYRVIAVKRNDNQVESVSNIVELTRGVDLYIPNAFTPNNDGINDNFSIMGDGIDELEVHIFNRFGEIIFTSNSLDSKWDGTYQSLPVPNGVYVYKVKAINKIKNKWVEKDGHVTVMR